MELILKLPTKPSKALSSEQLTESLEILEEHLSTYSDMVHDEIIAAAIKINNLGASANLGNRAGIAAKASFWFKGDAGVGKTESAEVLARALNRSFCKFNLATVAVGDLLGRTASNNFDSSEKAGEIGVLAKCFVAPDIGEASADPIIFIDEVHDILNGKGENARKFYMLLKLITEGRETEILENSLGIKLNLSHVIFIFGSNTSIRHDAANALALRVKAILFDSLSKDQKMEISRRHFEKLSILHRYKPEESDQEQIKNIVESDESPGARVLINVIEEYIIHQQACALKMRRCKVFDSEKIIKNNGGITKK